jgi:hypothetical protein
MWGRSAALEDLAGEGAILVDPFTIPNEQALEEDLWCGDFEADLNHYLDQHPNAPYHSLKSIVDSGLYLPYINGAIAPPKPNPDGTLDRRSPCPDVYHDPPKIAFRNALTEAIQRDQLDAIIYPTWSNPPRKVGDTTSPAVDNSQVLSSQTGLPAITVPMDFTHGTLPAGLAFLGTAPFTERSSSAMPTITKKPRATTSRRYSSRRCRPPCIPLGGDPPPHEPRCRSRIESCPHRCYVYGRACAIAAGTRRAARH